MNVLTANFPQFIRDNYEIHEWRHACAILTRDFPQEYSDICDVLDRFRLRKSHIAVGGGRKSKVADWIDSQLTRKGWVEKNFNTSITVDDNSGQDRDGCQRRCDRASGGA
jgi:hypothetical protein